MSVSTLTILYIFLVSTKTPTTFLIHSVSKLMSFFSVNTNYASGHIRAMSFPSLRNVGPPFAADGRT